MKGFRKVSREFGTLRRGLIMRRLAFTACAMTVCAMTVSVSASTAEPYPPFEYGEGHWGEIELVDETFHAFTAVEDRMELTLLEKRSWASEGYEGYAGLAELEFIKVDTRAVWQQNGTYFDVSCTMPYQVHIETFDELYEIKLDERPKTPKGGIAADLWWAVCHEDYFHYTTHERNW